MEPEVPGNPRPRTDGESEKNVVEGGTSGERSVSF